MNNKSHLQIIDSEIDKLVNSFLPNEAGTMTETRLRLALNQIGHVAFREGQSYALLSLMTVQDVATQLGISERRVRALAKDRHERSGIGYQVPGHIGAWLFKPEEIDALRPGKSGRPRKAK